MKQILNRINFGLSLILAVLGVLAFLAGTDILHAKEPDLSTEWTMLSAFFYGCGGLIVLNIVSFFVKDKKPT